MYQGDEMRMKEDLRRRGDSVAELSMAKNEGHF